MLNIVFGKMIEDFNLMLLFYRFQFKQKILNTQNLFFTNKIKTFYLS